MTSWLGFDKETPPRTRWVVVGVLFAAVVAFSSSGVLVRGMQAEPLAIAAWRTLGATLVLLPAAWGGLMRLSARDAGRVALGGIALALHFWSWFASLGETTILRSTVLVCTVPAFTALLEWLLWGQAPRRTHWLGLLLALPGLTLLGTSEGRATWQGDGLALLAALLWAVYFMLGREVRQRVDIAAAMGAMCAAAAATLFLLAFAQQTPLGGYPSGTWGRIGLAVLGPQLIGHQGFVYAVKWLPASTISALTLLEPVGATLLALLVLGEVPPPLALAGGVLVLMGIAVSTRA
jgi:drug/metabolite transporter (DMT)-like permease